MTYLLTAGGVIQGDHVSKLIILLHKVELLGDARVVLEAVLPDLEHDLDHVLGPLVKRALVQHVPQPLEDGVDATWRHLAQLLSDLNRITEY